MTVSEHLDLVSSLPQKLLTNLLERMPAGLSMTRVADGLVITFGPEGDLSFNYAAGFRRPLDHDGLSEIVAIFRARQINRGLILLGEEAMTDDWPALCVDFGIEPAGVMTKLVAQSIDVGLLDNSEVSRNQGSARSELTVREVLLSEAALAASFVTELFGSRRPAPIAVAEALLGSGAAKVFGAFSEDRLVGLGIIEWVGEAAYLSTAGTHPDYRRRGIHQELVNARIQAALSQGCTTVSVDVDSDVTDQSHRNLVRAGFSPAYNQSVWLWQNRFQSRQPVPLGPAQVH